MELYLAYMINKLDRRENTCIYASLEKKVFKVFNITKRTSYSIKANSNFGEHLK